MTNPRTVSDALASFTDDYDVRAELHAVPPHAVYEVRVDGTHAVCKVARGPKADLSMEAAALRYVARETSLPVPRVLAAGDGFFVAEWCDDAPDPDADTVSTEKARAMGEGLATLHAETESAVESCGFLAGRPREDPELRLDPHESWAATAADHVDDCVTFLRRVGDDESAALAADVREFLRARPAVFEGVGDPVLCHGNWLPAHVGVTDGTVTCVLDFEHALAGPPEYDYWRTVGPTFEGPDDGRDAAYSAFHAGYESVRSLPEGLDRRAAAFRVVNFVSYLRSLHVQRGPLDTAEKRGLAATFREVLRDTLDAE
ncbi:phosphotransferase family protein [Halospeciosus flavus]|uniref:Phosphotransferase family protein n=1 Tax=Halospeciosus flavus TaxID=3032283 RepID=A0ABD5Z5L7_9EURY|nr:phosphotransferase [Halospeciosus flavus]